MGTLRSVRDDPSMRQVPCEYEGCEQTMAVGDSFSFVITFATTGPAHVAAFGCPAEQHFACSVAHAAALATRCVAEHLIPAHLAAQAQAARARPGPTDAEYIADALRRGQPAAQAQGR